MTDNPLIALQNDPAIKAVVYSDAGELVAALSVSTTDYEDAGEAIAERVDHEMTFIRATERGQLFFRPHPY